MTNITQKVRYWAAKFVKDEAGATSIEFVIVFPVFMLFFGMIYESGMVSARHVMLERGVDIAVRDVRIGVITDPTPDRLRARICEVALLIPNCDTQLKLDMVTRSLRDWTPIPTDVLCANRGDPAAPKVRYTNGGNNELVYLRVCARFDPVMPTTGLGKAIVENNSDSAAGGSFALIASSAFVVEPFRREEE
ncbi:TadE/TadG family type IV pilus assembly protein [Yoonia sediminilitoris]|uniref:TadE-like protein n=1 Tax=Yoonia sediminilitoris TaxID=1286148 RepID=A0A2T6KQE5_9RHOB|nr:TadE/TadG family type IV pilus assembly protein [Yoonia sediminilitoris]PUB18779.1 TadE-like protein [Yoonia sediminilitoris]RCW98947.1 TadE-like protein [Yoonia sediminilitoris]